MQKNYRYRPGYKKKSVFWSVVICVFTIVFIGIVLVWNYLWNYLVAYEQHNPSYTVEKYLDLFRNGQLSKLFELESTEFDYFNDEEAYKKYINDNYGNDFSEIKALKTKSEGENLNYNIYLGSKKISEITLSPDGKKGKYDMVGWNLSAHNKYPKNHSVKVCIPSGTALFIDQKEVGKDYLSTEKYTVHDYSELNDQSLAPKFEVYEVKNLLNKPEITVKNKGGKELSFTENNGTFYALEAIPADLEKMIKEKSEFVAVKYALYSILDLKFNDISPYFFKDSGYYKKIKSFANDWYKEHTFSYDTVKFGEIIQYDETHIVTNISFTYHVNIGYRTNDYNVKYRMSFIKVGEEWLVAQMKL